MQLGMMDTHDEETQNFFKNSSVQCILTSRSQLNLFKYLDSEPGIVTLTRKFMVLIFYWRLIQNMLKMCHFFSNVRINQYFIFLNYFLFEIEFYYSLILGICVWSSILETWIPLLLTSTYTCEVIITLRVCNGVMF